MMRLTSWRLVMLASLMVAITAASCAKAGDENAAATKAAPAEKAAKSAPNAQTPAPGEEKAMASEDAAPSGDEMKAAKADGEKPAMDADGYAVGARPQKPKTAPDRVRVQHILIGFQGSVPGKNITRTKAEAKTLAYEVLERAQKGEDFDALVREYTNDSAPGIYAMANTGVTPNPGEAPRDRMVGAFGDVGFNIMVGNIGIADWDAQRSPFGWHIIKRLK